jgi:hypothetical protein
MSIEGAVCRKMSYKLDIPEFLRLDSRDPRVYFMYTTWEAGQMESGMDRVLWSAPGGQDLIVPRIEFFLPVNPRVREPGPANLVQSNARVVQLGCVSLDLPNLKAIKDMTGFESTAAKREAAIHMHGNRIFVVGEALSRCSQYISLRDSAICIRNEQDLARINSKYTV